MYFYHFLDLFCLNNSFCEIFLTCRKKLLLTANGIKIDNNFCFITWKDILKKQNEELDKLGLQQEKTLEKMLDNYKEQLRKQTEADIKETFKSIKESPEKQQEGIKNRAAKKVDLIQKIAKAFNDELETQSLWLKKLTEFQKEELKEHLAQSNQDLNDQTTNSTTNDNKINNQNESEKKK